MASSARLLLVLLVALLAASTLAGETVPAVPILRIETGMHTAPINRIGVDAAGRFLVTGSDDKTVRVWDLMSGEQLRVLRSPIGEGGEGKIYAVAITPDGELVAAGGWTSPNGLQTNIYLFDRRTGRLVRRIDGLPNVVRHLAFSPDSLRLAAILGGANELWVFHAADGVELFRDTEPESSSSRADFDAAGRLVTSSFDGKLRLYGPDYRKLTTREAPGGKRPFGVAFSPDGRQIAVGYYDSTRVDVLSGSDLQLLFSADTVGTNGGLGNVAWSTDGAFLFAAGRYDVSGKNLIRRWAKAGRGPARDLAGSLTTVMDLHPLPDGRLVFGAADPAWGVLNASGERVLGTESPKADFRGLLDDFRIDRSGERVRYGYQYGGKRPAIFSLRERRLVLDPPAADRFDGEPLIAPRTSVPGLEVAGWKSTTEPRLNGNPLPLKSYETSRCLAIAADGRSFLLGADWYLRAFRANGTALWPVPVPAPSAGWAVNLTPDGRLALAAFGDGTIRWFRARDGVELLAFFPHPDGRRWVLWTPKGYYDASVDGEDLIGWHVNNGPDEAADFFSAWHFRDTYRRPDVIDLVLETLDEDEALRRAGVRAAEPSTPAPPPLPALPPVVTILEPADGETLSTPTVKLRVNVRSPSGAKVDQLLIKIDGRPLATRDAVWSPSAANAKARDFYEEREIPVPQRDFVLEVSAEAGGRRSEPARRQLRWVAPAPEAERRAWVLAVGVSKYERPEYKLAFAAKDAEDVAAAWKALEGRAFAKVETRVLTDDDAHRDAILDGFDWLSAVPAANDGDLIMVFLAGHGVNETGQYFFLPHDADPARRSRTFLSQSQIYDGLRALPRRVLLFLDTCRAGSLATAGQDAEIRQRVDATAFVNDLAYNARVLVFSATARLQLSQESPKWKNGAFTKALVKALTAAKSDQRQLTTTELERSLLQTVSDLTDKAQTPTVAKAGLPDLVLVPGSR